MASSRPKKRRAASTSTSRKSSSEKTRNGGQWTEARYESFITSVLRSGSRRWPPKWAALKAAFKREGINPKTKRHAKLYGCTLCGGEFSSKDVQVDHTDPIGSCTSWDEFIEKLYCETTNLQVVCKVCHKIKTKEEREGKKESGNT
jgi:5-methylcytosine-specific restriction endonuclease McrA